MTINRPKAIKYVVLFVICLLLMMFGASLIVPIAIKPLQTISGYSREVIANAIEAFQNYNSSAKYDEYMTWAEYAHGYFEADPVLFKNIKTFFCVIQLLSYIPLLVVIIYFLRKEFVSDFINFKKDIKKNVVIIVVGYLGMMAVAYLVAMVYGLIGIEGESNNEVTIDLMLNSPGAVAMVIAVVLIAPFVEEVIFRKLLMGTCEETFRFPPVVGIIVSSLVFSFIHVSDLESLKFIFQYLALAVPICVAYHKSGNNIYVTLILHIINNAISVIITFIGLS